MQIPDGKPGHYYVTARDRGKTAFLLGPFTQTRPGTLAHRQALGMVKMCRSSMHRNFSGAAFAEVGTARLPLTATDDPPIGKLGRARITFKENS